ncbi:MAG: hypothetical protein UT76_C0008G0010 [Candidatus Woesebacteria bacterium GW2011_GWB1_40_12]|uniref:Mannosyl-glycoprotein endo-beta-N-acetylglucosamidase-like domain-containing protein n=1 Tax=Candidatus Woesebacteria bacterium GW2011_GWB1_40_12 TaxID=1618576 RepID=A0A0G0QTL7_9BACT|nr:MAG: hypothetical protein UT76_C0008G0010 [Candidatus Woesebacteria bacterium GW2011_GWB1_40_12]
MSKIIAVIIILIALVFTGAGKVDAQNISGESAWLKADQAQEYFDFRVENLRNFLQKYNSPLAPYAEEFVIYADKNDLDYRLVPAITGVESTFGKRIPVKSYNAYGWANGEYKFTSWENSIEHVSGVLKDSYIDRGAVSIYQIAKRYAPPSTTWGGKVSFFVSKIDTLPLDFDIVI